MHPTIRVKDIRDFADLEALQEDWNALLASTDNAVFSTWEWITCWWKHFGQKRQLRVLVAEEDSNVVAIAPLMLSEYRLMKIGTLRKIEFIGTPDSDVNNFLWLRRERDCLSLFLEYLVKRNDWDCLELGDVRQDSVLARHLSDLHPGPPWEWEERVASVSPYIELPNTFGELTDQLGSVMRHNVNRRSRRLAEKHKIEVQTSEDFGSLDKAMEVMFELHQKRRANVSNRPSTFAAPQTRDFHNDLAKQFAAKKWLALNFLTADGEPVATTYSFEYGQKTYVYQVGFDPRFSRYGVGTLLHLRNIEENIGRHLREYDFLKGDEAYKFSWPVSVRHGMELRLMKPNFLVRIHSLAEKEKRQLGKVLRRTDVRQMREKSDGDL